MTGLARRPLGRTGLDVAVLGFGAMELRGAPRGRAMDPADEATLLNAVLDSGIDFLDTSIDYGRSEAAIGEHLGARRDEFVLATKCGCVPGRWGEHAFDAATVRAGIEHSLRTIGTDRLDLVQFHMSPTADELRADDALAELLRQRDAGTVRFVGMSGRLPNIWEQLDLDVFNTFQIPYSVMQRDHANAIAEAQARGAGVIVRGGIARGIPGEWGADDVQIAMMPSADEMRSLWEEAALDELLGDMSRLEFTLRFTISDPAVSTVIVGTSRPEHLAGNVAAATAGPLPADLIERVTARLDAIAAPVRRPAPTAPSTTKEQR